MVVYGLFKGLFGAGLMAYLRGCSGRFYGMFKGLFRMVLLLV